mgnify:CR=1 FL=1
MNEMVKLRRLLEESGIEWVDATDSVGIPEGVAHVLRTQSPTWASEEEPRWSVICGPGTYGGDVGLLELWFGRSDREPIGYLTASEAYDMI